MGWYTYASDGPLRRWAWAVTQMGRLRRWALPCSSRVIRIARIVWDMMPRAGWRGGRALAVAVSEEEPPSLPTPHVQSKEMVCIRVLAYGCDDKGRPLLPGRRRPNPGNVLHCLRFLLADALRALPFGALWPTVSGSCAVFFEMPARHERLLRQWNVAQRKSRMRCGCCSYVGLWLILVTRDSRLKEINLPSWPRTHTHTRTH